MTMDFTNPCGLDLSGFDAILSIFRKDEEAMEYARPRYLLVSWKVVPDPRKVPVLYKRDGKGYYNYRGWVGCSGRLTTYIWDVEDYRTVRKYEDQHTDLDDQVFCGNYVRLLSDIFMFKEWEDIDRKGRSNPPTGPGKYLEVYVPRDVWESMSPHEQWDYMRDISYWGKSYSYEKHKLQRTQLIKKRMEEYSYDKGDLFLQSLLKGETLFYENLMHGGSPMYSALLAELSKFDHTSPGHLSW